MTIADIRLASGVQNRLNWYLNNRSLNRAKNIMFDIMDLWTIGECNAITEKGIPAQGLNFRVHRQHAQLEPGTRCMAVNELIVNLWVKLTVVISHQGERIKNHTSSTHRFYTPPALHRPLVCVLNVGF
jgi:hypothetical protein